MQLKRWIVLAVLAAALVLTTGIQAAQQTNVRYDKWGPKVDEIIMPIIKEPEAQRIAFERGETVVLPGLTRPEDIDRIKRNPNADITMNLGFHMFYLAFNMRRAPLSDLVIRQAIAHVVNRDQIINQLFQGYMLPLESFVPQSSPFYNPNVDSYPYNPTRAREILDKAGYKLDPKSGVRIDPKTGNPLRKMYILTPTYEVAPTSAELGRMIAEAARAIGLPVEAQPMDFPTMLEKIDIFEFDMYLLAWGLERNPTFLYDFFHSSNDVKAGYNTPGIRNAELDRALEELYYAPDRATAQRAANKAQEILSREIPYVVLYSRPYIDAWRKDMVTGYIPMLGYGAANYQNQWTTLNIRRRAGEGGTIRWLLPEEPKNLNVVTASSAYEFEVLGRIYEGMYAIDPVTMQDIPWLAESWDVGTWEPAPGKKGTVVTWHIRKGVKWQDGMPFTSADVKFTIEFMKKNEVPLYQSRWKDIVKVETPDQYTAKVYFGTQSYWHLYNADFPWLPKHIWEDVKDYTNFQPWLEPHPTVKGLTKAIGTGPFILKEYKPGEYVRLVKNPNYWALKPWK
ncbi:MAG: ABC transporter substrate-binding protein [Limnochordales bacterium]|nr:ABC transporter substrate-binding protein [Limnochordales bacterium]